MLSLDAQARAAEFMEGSAMSVAAGALAQELTTIATLVGKEVGTYKIEKLLGAGGMAEVYLARDSKLDRMIALKILPWHFLADADRIARFRREARALTSLNHPNLITIYEVGEANGLHFIATEFVEGQTLSSLRTKLSVKELLSIVAQVAEALAAAHRSGVVHRDIKPDNVMVRPDGYVKVLDFGLVKLMEVSSDRQDVANTQIGVAMGTLSYMSPEQAAGEPIDHRTDIWSLGVVLYELVAGQRPSPEIHVRRRSIRSFRRILRPRVLSIQTCLRNSIRCSTKHSRRTESYGIKRRQTSAPTSVACCARSTPRLRVRRWDHALVRDRR